LDRKKRGNKYFARHRSCSFFESKIDPTAPPKLNTEQIKEKGVRNGGEGTFEAR
jgi:hypothetical protein